MKDDALVTTEALLRLRRGLQGEINGQFRLRLIDLTIGLGHVAKRLSPRAVRTGEAFERNAFDTVGLSDLSATINELIELKVEVVLSAWRRVLEAVPG